MEKLIPVYRIVGYVLLAIAGLLSLLDLIGLLISFANPTMFLFVFMLTSVIIYTFTSFYFDRKGVQKGETCKPSLRDWIRVNSFVTIVFCVLTLTDCVVLLSDPAAMSEYCKQIIKTQPSYASAGITKEYLTHMFAVTLYFFIVYASLLLLHVIVTFRVLKQYGYLFGRTDKPQPN